MHAGGGCVVADRTRRTSSRFTGRKCAEPGRRIGLVGLGRRPRSRAADDRRITRSRRTVGVTATLVCASASAPATARVGPKQSATAGTTGRPVITGPIVAASSRRASAPQRFHGRRASDFSSIGHLSCGLRSPSAHAGCDALSGAGTCRWHLRRWHVPAGLRTIPLRRFRSCRPARCCGTDRRAFARAVFRRRRSKAASLVVSDVWGGSRSTETRRVNAAAK